MDVAQSGKSLDRDMLDFIYPLKTGALIEAAMMVGAVLAGASEEQVKTVEKIAGDIGLAFQIEDDILDVTSTTEELGKPVHSDEKNEKTTYVTIRGLAGAREDAAAVSREAVELLEGLGYENPFLVWLVGELVHRKK